MQVQILPGARFINFLLNPESVILNPLNRMTEIEKFYMSEAFKEAVKAASEDEVPIGCVIVKDKAIIARGHNQVECLRDPTAHAEMIAITAAANALGSKWLNGAEVYVTIEPCSMCAGALVLARVARLVYGADDPKAGACGSVLNIINNKDLNHRIAVEKGVLGEECGLLLSEFFKKKRKVIGEVPEWSNGAHC